MSDQLGLETVLVAMILAAGLGFLAWRIRPVRWRGVAFVVAAALTTTGAWTAMMVREAPLSEEQISYRPIVAEDESYVTSDTCRSCHPSEYATWHDSYHRRMTQVASPESVLGHFEGQSLEYHGKTYRLKSDGELLWMEWSEPVAGAEPRVVKRPVVLTTGSHHHQAYWLATADGRAVEFAPFIYLIPERRWVPRESVFIQPTVSVDTPLRQLNVVQDLQKNRQWNHSCIHCHTTRGQPGLSMTEGDAGGIVDFDTRVAEFGIACEACHGPGREHVARNRDPLRRFRHHLGGAGDDTIVDPQDLPPKKASQVCGICHSVTYPRPGELAAELDEGRRFRPGDELADTRVICRASPGHENLDECPVVVPEQRFWSDGMVRVSGREYTSLLDAPCYQRGELTCFSCHGLHQDESDPRARQDWADDQLKPGMEGDGACLGCHTSYESTAALAAHTHHAPESSGSRCYNCHMPFTSYGLLKAVRSHQIDSPTVQASVETGRPNACNQCHLDKSLAWAAEHLEGWYGVTPPELDEVSRAVPASLVWLLSGDAGQRALMAWTLGWEAARDASRGHWTTPFLAVLLDDPYDAVRLTAWRSLRRRPGFEDFEYDFLGPASQRRAAAERAGRLWASLDVPEGQVGNARELLVDGAGALPEDIFAHLLRQRDDRVVMLAE